MKIQIDSRYLSKMENLANNQELPPARREELSQVVEDIRQEGSPLMSDKWIYRGVVTFLGLAILGCLYFTFHLTLPRVNVTPPTEMPEIFLAIGSGAVGALAGLLAPRPGSGSNTD